MSIRIAYPYDPEELDARNPPFVQDLIDLKVHGYTESVMEIIKMISDLKLNGKDCRFLKQLRNYSILELKTHSRGGQKGGARAYLFRYHETFFVCRAEWKPGDEPSQDCLEDTAFMLLAFKQRRTLFPSRMKNPPKFEKEQTP